MPTEFSRTTARKRITLPSGAQVDVKVITGLTVVDASDRYQETQFTIDNTSTSSRTVHIDTIYASTPDGQQDFGSSIQVERIDVWPVTDATDRAQETQVTFDNVTGATSIPPHFSTHQRTHLVKYRGVSNPDVWIESELIDEVRVLDGSDRFQETWLTLNQPQNDTDAAADPADADISDSGNGIDPAWRTDPFQNIVNFKDATTQIFPPPYAISYATIDDATIAGQLMCIPQMYAVSAGIAGTNATFSYPTTFPAPTSSNIAIDPSTIELLNGSNTGMDHLDATGVSFWGRQNNMPTFVPISPPIGMDVSTQSCAGMTISNQGYTLDFSSVEFVPFQYQPGTSNEPGNFLDYYPNITTGMTGWKYVPHGVFFQDGVNFIWLIWEPVET